MANFVLATGRRGVALLHRFESDMGHKDIGPGTFRCMEGMYVQEDYGSVLEQLEVVKKINPSKVREVVAQVLLRRWLNWSLQHPDLGADRIHPSRSMFTPCLL